MANPILEKYGIDEDSFGETNSQEAPLRTNPILKKYGIGEGIFGIAQDTFPARNITPKTKGKISEDKPSFFKEWGSALWDTLRHPFTPITEEQGEQFRAATKPETFMRKESDFEQWIRESLPEMRYKFLSPLYETIGKKRPRGAEVLEEFTEVKDRPSRYIKTKVPREIKNLIKKYNVWRESPESKNFRDLENAAEVAAPIAMAGIIGLEAIKAFVYSPMGQELLARKVTPKQAMDIYRRVTTTGRSALTKWENKVWQFLNDRGLLKEAARYGVKVPIFKGEPQIAYQRIAPLEQKFYAGLPVPKEIISKYNLTSDMVQRISRGDFTNIPAVATSALAKAGIIPSEGMAPRAGELVQGVPAYVKKVMEKGVTITSRDAPILMDKTLTVKDIHGNKVKLPKGEEYTPFKLSNGKVWLHDGKNIVVDKNQLEQVKGEGTELTGFPEREPGIEIVEKGAGLETLPQFLKTPEGEATNIGSYTIDIKRVGNRYLGNVFSPYDTDAVLSEVGNTPEEVKSKLLASINANKDLMADANIGKTKFSQYQLPGGQDYRETLIKAPLTTDLKPNEYYTETEPELGEIVAYNYKGEEIASETSEAAIASILSQQGLTQTQKTNMFYQSSHWDEPNVVAHIRHNTRTTPDGKKVLFIEEVQSDWAKAGREKGFKETDKMIPKEAFLKLQKNAVDAVKRNDLLGFDTASEALSTILGYSDWATRWEVPSQDDVNIINKYREAWQINQDFANKVPFHPAVKKWKDLAAQEIVRIAREGNYDIISWTTGQQQADRYDLSKQVDFIRYVKKGNETWIQAQKRSQVIIQKYIPNEQLGQTIGKELANKIITGQEESGRFSGVDLKIGGEWAKSLYDVQLPKLLKRITGGETGKVDLGKAFLAKPQTGPTGEMLPREEGQLTQPAVILDKAKLLGPRAGGINITNEVLQNSKKYGINEEQLKWFQEESEAAHGSKEIQKANQSKATQDIRDVHPSGPIQAREISEIAKELESRGFIDYRGRTINSPQELAELATAFRHPKIEQLQIFYLKNKKIVAHRVLTSGQPDYGNFDENFSHKIKAAAKRLDATQIYIAHNHPSGNSMPSENDIHFVAYLNYKTDGLIKGHIVINGGEYHVIEKGYPKEWETTKYSFKEPKAEYRRELVKVYETSDVVKEAKNFIQGGKLNIVFIDTKNHIISIDNIGLDKNIRQYIKEAKRNYGTSRYMVIQSEMKRAPKLLYPSGLVDYLFMDLGTKEYYSPGHSGLRTLGISMESEAPPTKGHYGIQEKISKYKGVPRTIGGIVKQAGYIDPEKALRAGWSKEDIKELQQYMKQGGLSPDVMADELRVAGELLSEEAQYGFPSDVLLEALKEKQPTITALEGKILKAKREDTSTGEMIKGVKEPKDFRDIEKGFPPSEPPPKFPGVSDKFLEQPKPTTSIVQYFTPAEYHLKELGFDQEIGQPIREALQDFSIELMKKNEFVKKVQEIHYRQVPKYKRKASLRKIWDLMDKDIPVDDTSPEALIARRYREGTIEMLERMNKLRARIGEEPIQGVKNYILYMLKPEFLNEIYATGVIPPELAKVMEYIPPKKVFLRTAELRKGIPEEWLLKDPHALMRAMYAIDLRYIYLQDVLDRIDPYLNAVKDYIGPGGERWSTASYKYLDDWIKQAIKMRPSSLDTLVDNLLEYTFAPLLRNMGLKVSHMPWRDLINFLSASVHTGALGMRVKPILRNFVQSSFDWVMYGTVAYSKGSMKFMTKEGLNILRKSKVWQTRVPYEAQDLATLQRLFKIGGLGYRISDLHNVGKGLLTRYYHAIDTLGYSPEKALKWADLDLPRTQWSYRREDLPRVYWSTTGRALWTLGSWWMNFYTNFMPELIRRGFTGKDVSGRIVSTTERLGILRFLILVGMLYGVKKASRELTGTVIDYTAQVKPKPGFSPIAKLLAATYYFAFGLIDNDKRMLNKGLSELKRTGKIFIPWELAAEDVFNIFSGKKTWQEILFYGKQPKPSGKNPILEKYDIGKKRGKNPILKKYGIK